MDELFLGIPVYDDLSSEIAQAAECFLFYSKVCYIPIIACHVAEITQNYIT